MLKEEGEEDLIDIEQILSVNTYDITKHIIMFDQYWMYLLDLEKNTCKVFYGQYIISTCMFSSKILYVLTDDWTSGLAVMNME